MFGALILYSGLASPLKRFSTALPCSVPLVIAVRSVSRITLRERDDDDKVILRKSQENLVRLLLERLPLST
jgi:hypothetical protein